MQADPIGYKDGPNWYEYTHDDPVNHGDPSGTAGLPCAEETYCDSSVGGIPQGAEPGSGEFQVAATSPVSEGAVGKTASEAAAKSDDLAASIAEGAEIRLEQLVDVILTDSKAAQHILDGDATGGGHKFGTGVSGKSEFPASWSGNKILHEASDVATDPLASHTKQGGRIVSEGVRDGVTIRVVSDGKRIITAYPVGRSRNP